MRNFLIDTGIDGSYVISDAVSKAIETLTPRQQDALKEPSLSPETLGGKTVGSFEKRGPDEGFQVVPPVGTYKIALKTPVVAGYQWPAIPSSVRVIDGRFTPVKVILERVAAP